MAYRPPRPLIIARPINEWINRVNQKYEAFAKLPLSAESKDALAAWLAEEFADSSLRLVSDDSVTKSGGAPSGESKNEGAARSPESHNAGTAKETRTADLDRACLAAALDIAREGVKEGRSAKFTQDLLRQLHGAVSPSSQEFRRGPALTRRAPKPPPADSVPAIVDAMCRWTDADSFVELHPVEQSAIVHLRLIEIQPFEQSNEVTALVAASFFLVRAGLPPLIIKPDLNAAYITALDEATRLNTRPMVELVADATEQTLNNLISRATER